VMFLTFREAQERIDKHLLGGTPLRDSKGARNLVWVLDLDHDGYMDVLNGEKTRLWDSKRGAWKEIKGPKGLWSPYLRFAVVSRSGMPSAIANAFEAWRFDGQAWVEDPRLRSGLERGLEVYRDLDGDGICERIQGHPESDGIDVWTEKGWEPATIRLPAALVDKHGHDRGLRFVDLNGDGRDDIVSSNEKEWSVHVWVSMEKGWERVSGGKRGDPGEIPMIVRGPTNNGAWFHSKHLWVQNEDTAKMPNLVDRRSFEALLERR